MRDTERKYTGLRKAVCRRCFDDRPMPGPSFFDPNNGDAARTISSVVY
jgi:hypothetical protein